jgi:hypothetical protein
MAQADGRIKSMNATTGKTQVCNQLEWQGVEENLEALAAIEAPQIWRSISMDLELLW